MSAADMGYTASGRWGGRLTSRPLPRADAAVEALPAQERAVLSRIWLHRAAMERRVADSFEVIRGALERRRAPEELVALSVRAVDDEHRHTELSRVVASRFAGRELPLPPRLVLEVPKHASASPELRDTLFVVGQCVFNETTASAFLETCVTAARGELARAALRELLSDEIDHGRIGWAYLATLDAGTRAEVSRWLLPMAYLNLRLWQRESPADPAYRQVYAEHGAPHRAAIHETLTEALRALIVPGLRELGLRTRPIEAWLEAGAFTDRPPTEFG
jgi:hypothetical protein